MAAVGGLYKACGHGHVAVHFDILHSHPFDRFYCRCLDGAAIQIFDEVIVFDRHTQSHLVDIHPTRLPTATACEVARKPATMNINVSIYSLHLTTQPSGRQTEAMSIT